MMRVLSGSPSWSKTCDAGQRTNEPPRGRARVSGMEEGRGERGERDVVLVAKVAEEAGRCAGNEAIQKNRVPRAAKLVDFHQVQFR